MSPYAPLVNIRQLFAIFVALAVLFGPAIGRAGAAFAAAPDHHMQMTESGHCKVPPGGSADHDKAPAKDCCVSMCMVAAISPSAPTFEAMARPDSPAFSVPAFHLAYLGEISTPPPRSA